MRHRGQLKSNGSIGTPESFNFITADVVAERLIKDGTDMMLTIGLTFRNPRTKDKVFGNIEAIRWMRDQRNARAYTFEAWYTGSDEYLHVNALSDGDLF